MKGDERILGDSDFVQQSLQKADEQLERKYRIRSKGYDMGQIAKRVAQLMNIAINEVFAAGKNRHRVRARSLLCYFAVRECGMSMVWLSNRLGISQTAVSQSVKRGEKIALENKFRLTQ
jgi:chromosomal replication initiation ATPase DnaA